MIHRPGSTFLMRPEQWQQFKAAAKRRHRGRPVPLALIADSPWIPTYAGVSHWDYFFDAEAWFAANLRVLRDFPEVIWFPAWWSEVGMGAEPSALGARVRFNRHRVPDVEPPPFRPDLLDRLTRPDPRTDSFMALCLYRYHRLGRRIREAGYCVPVVAARGPLTIASFVWGVNDLMTDLVDTPERVLQLLEVTTELAIGWLRAQAEALDGGVEGILILDDLAGFIGRLTLMGNVPPLDLGVRGTPEQVHAAALRALHEAGDHPLILSFAGVTTTGTPPENIRAMIRAAAEFNAGG